jgi:hypothetical protein
LTDVGLALGLVISGGGLRRFAADREDDPMFKSVKLAWYRTTVSTTMATSQHWQFYFGLGNFKRVMDATGEWQEFDALTEVGYKNGVPPEELAESYNLTALHDKYHAAIKPR